MLSFLSEWYRYIKKNFIVLSWNLMNKWASLPQKHKSNKILYRLKYEDVLYYRVVCQTSYAKNSTVNLDQKGGITFYLC